jgi:hypothetical protein
MIQAARSALDLMEDVVADPQSLAAVVSQLGHLAQALMAAGSQTSPTPSKPGQAARSRSDGPSRSDGASRSDGPTHDGVQHIPLN